MTSQNLSFRAAERRFRLAASDGGGNSNQSIDGPMNNECVSCLILDGHVFRIELGSENGGLLQSFLRQKMRGQKALYVHDYWVIWLMGHLGHKFRKRFLLFRLSLQNRAKVILFFHNWLASSSRKEVSTIYKETRNVHKFFSFFLFRITKSSAVWFCGWRILKSSEIQGGIEAWRTSWQLWGLEWRFTLRSSTRLYRWSSRDVSLEKPTAPPLSNSPGIF